MNHSLLFNDFQPRSTIGKLDLKRIVYSQLPIIIPRMTERLLRGGSSIKFRP